jgi:hypothetical protein
MRTLRSKKLIALVATVLVAAAASAVGIAGVVSRTVLADGENIHYSVIKFVADDYDSGWLEHHGLVVIQVQQGSLQITQGSCTAKTVGAGETFIKVPYSPVRGVSTGRVVFTATFLVRYEDPLSITVPSPCP